MVMEEQPVKLKFAGSMLRVEMVDRVSAVFYVTLIKLLASISNGTVCPMQHSVHETLIFSGLYSPVCRREPHQYFCALCET